MAGKTYRIVTIWFCFLFGLAWGWLTFQSGAMYVPPLEIGSFMVALLGGKWWQSMEHERAPDSWGAQSPLQSYHYDGTRD